jgi:hypothetical protein
VTWAVSTVREPGCTFQRYQRADSREGGRSMHRVPQGSMWFPRISRPHSPWASFRPRVERNLRRGHAPRDIRNHRFYFRGPDNRHKTKAHDLAILWRIAAGIPHCEGAMLSPVHSYAAPCRVTTVSSSFDFSHPACFMRANKRWK